MCARSGCQGVNAAGEMLRRWSSLHSGDVFTDRLRLPSFPTSLQSAWQAPGSSKAQQELGVGWGLGGVGQGDAAGAVGGGGVVAASLSAWTGCLHPGCFHPAGWSEWEGEGLGMNGVGMG